uniref:Uncharacterized protein n=1 Tax=Arundo donax TaxID=35708 RepID=A0A0A8XQM0_ARUDO
MRSQTLSSHRWPTHHINSEYWTFSPSLSY